MQEEGNDLRWEKPLLDDRERERVLKHCELVVQCGGIPWLVRLCASADGPLEERDPNFDPAASGKKGKGKKAKKKGKKAKLEPGAWPKPHPALLVGATRWRFACTVLDNLFLQPERCNGAKPQRIQRGEGLKAFTITRMAH